MMEFELSSSAFNIDVLGDDFVPGFGSRVLIPNDDEKKPTNLECFVVWGSFLLKVPRRLHHHVNHD
jgi:hypothetical protein